MSQLGEKPYKHLSQPKRNAVSRTLPLVEIADFQMFLLASTHDAGLSRPEKNNISGSASIMESCFHHCRAVFNFTE